MKSYRVLLVAAVAGVVLGLVTWHIGKREGAPEPAAREGEPGPGEPGVPPGPVDQEGRRLARGTVFLDENGNGSRDPGERGIPHVRVSDQLTVTETDREGQWSLPAHEEAIYFVVKPRGFRTPLSEQNLPLFYYIHREIQPPDIQGRSVQPTGPLPESIDFPLVGQEEADRFQMLVLGDPQPRNLEEVNYLAHDVLEELVGTSAAFALTLGDLAFDASDLYPAINRATGTVGIPFYNTHGNHDANYDGLDTYQHFETWRSVFGPRYYSFDYGPVHFMILSDVLYPQEGDRYITGLGEEQLEWIEADLSYVPRETLVVLAMHIPLTPASQTPDFGRLYEILKDRPHTLSFSAHLHTVSQGFLTEEHGWLGTTPHHHINAGATCGRWWGGARDETDIPHATSADGTPNGYFLVTFDGTGYSTRFKAARRPPDYQMQIEAPDEVDAARVRYAAVPVLVNFFNGNERSVVEMSVGGSAEWVPMRFAPQVDPLYARVTERESGQEASTAYHIWEGALPSDLTPGGHLIRVRATDMYGQVFTASRILRVQDQDGL